MNDKIVKLVKKPEVEQELIPAEIKAKGIEYLKELIRQVEANEVSAVFCCVGYGDEGTGGFRFGDQNLELIGYIDWFKHKLVEGMK